MADFRASEMIHRPIEEVFSYLSNLENAPNLLPFVVDMEKLSNGPVGNGSRFLETRLVRRRRIQAEVQITEFQCPSAFTSKSISNGVEILYHYTFSEIEEGTQVEMEAEVKTAGLLSFLTKKQLVKIIKNEDGGQLQKLKEVLETEVVHR
jgi:carbon monoxide dehydrogenase subunit G